MAQGFGKQRESDSSDEEEKSRILQIIGENKETILGVFWQNYLKDGIGAAIVRLPEKVLEITYRSKNNINDSEDLKIVEKNDPNTSAVVFGYFRKNKYVVLNLIGPETPPECYKNLPEIFKF
jgi:hypothetical protein